MKEKYRYDSVSGDSFTAGCIAVFVYLAWIGVCAAISVAAESSAVGVIVSILPLAVLIPAEAKFEADDKGVTFKYLLKKTVIPYDTIKSVEVKAEYRESRTRYGINRHYTEVITFHCENRDYAFGGKLETDFEQILKDPSYMQKQTENSKFTRLKAYIEGKMA